MRNITNQIFFVLITVLTVSTRTEAGEITFVEWHSSPYIPKINVTYFDTVGAKAVCTAFFKGKPVGASSQILSSGIAKVSIEVPETLKGHKDVKLTCRTE